MSQKIFYEINFFYEFSRSPFSQNTSGGCFYVNKTSLPPQPTTKIINTFINNFAYRFSHPITKLRTNKFKHNLTL